MTCEVLGDHGLATGIHRLGQRSSRSSSRP
jgi:hypothetical protein